LLVVTPLGVAMLDNRVIMHLLVDQAM